MAESYPRPNPDELLERIKIEEEQKTHGKLKIFLGYAAGVGKTYAMLEAARQRKKELDVVAAYVETHGRAETEALLEGLEEIPRKQVEYRGVILPEMDLDAVLARRPQLALVDELAHTNAPNSRHPKRYLDVEELLEAGIDVYTTLNIQHVESLRNVVVQITGAWMRETVPDSIIDKATEIELVDLPPSELLKRLKEGKVYISGQIASAIDNFFREGNLTALRELTMRTASERVDEQMRAYMHAHAIRGPWPTAERLLVCVSPGTLGTSLVRAARRLASQLGAEWLAVYVETPDSARQSLEARDSLMETLRLAEKMGAKTVTLYGDSVPDTIMEYVRTHNISKIVVGRPIRSLWQGLLRPSIVNQVIQRSDNIDVFIVSGKTERLKQQTRPAGPFSWPRRRYIRGIGIVTAATLIGELLRPVFDPANLIMLYLLGVILSAVYLGPGPSVLVSILSMLAFDFFFVPPIHTFRTTDVQYTFTLLALLGLALVTSYLTMRFRQQVEYARRREHDMSTLYSFGRKLSVATGLESTVQAIISGAKEIFERDVVVFLPGPHSNGDLKPHAADKKAAVDENEVAAAVWSFQHQKMVGPGTDTLPNAGARYIPLTASTGTVGVLALQMSGSKGELTVDEARLLEMLTDRAAVAIEHTRLAEAARNAQILEATEKLQTALLNSVSHDLRTPLVSIIGVLSSLQEEGIGLDEIASRNLILVASEDADRLNHLITNLLDVSRIEAGAIRLSRQQSDVQDLIGAALEQLGTHTVTHPIKINIPSALPFISVDFGLMVQTLFNILDNAFKYSPPDSPIEINGQQIDNQVEIVVADRGVGIPQQDLVRVFDKFYRVQRPDNVIGTGLGLSICKGIVEAHGGHIAAENRPGGGTIIRLTLPAAESTAKGTG